MYLEGSLVDASGENVGNVVIKDVTIIMSLFYTFFESGINASPGRLCFWSTTNQNRNYQHCLMDAPHHSSILEPAFQSHDTAVSCICLIPKSINQASNLLSGYKV